MRDGIIIGVITGAFFAALGAILTALAIKYATDSALWDVVLWAGITMMICSIVSLILFVAVQTTGRSFLGPALLINLGICLVVGGFVWYFSTKPTDGTRLTDRPNLLSLFVRDLKPQMGFLIDGCTEYDRPDFKGRIYYKIIGDVPSNSKFISFYIPSSPQSIQIIESIADEYNDWIEQIENTLHVHNHVQGNSTTTESKNMVFSHVVYVYHEDDLDAVQTGNLTLKFEAKNLTLQLRGTSYVLGAWDGIKAGRIERIAEYQTAGCRVVPVKSN